jgi:hypothetical protein
VGHVLAHAIVSHTALDGYAGPRYLSELERVVGLAIDGLGEVFADFVLVDIKGGNNFDVFDSILSDSGVHDSGDVNIVG